MKRQQRVKLLLATANQDFTLQKLETQLTNNQLNTHEGQEHSSPCVRRVTPLYPQLFKSFHSQNKTKTSSGLH